MESAAASPPPPVVDVDCALTAATRPQSASSSPAIAVSPRLSLFHSVKTFTLTGLCQEYRVMGSKDKNRNRELLQLVLRWGRAYRFLLILLGGLYLGYFLMKQHHRARGGVVKEITLENHAIPKHVLAKRMSKLSLPPIPDGAQPVSATEALDAYNKCFKDRLLGVDDENDKWNKFKQVIQECRESTWQMREMLISLYPYVNLYETKWSMDIDPAIFNSMGPGDCTVVTLGVGLDVRVELQMRDRFGKTCDYFGADPEINEQLYTSVGQFFPVAVGDSIGSFTAKVLAAEVPIDQSFYDSLLDFIFGRTWFWVPRPVVHIDLPSFITKIVQRKVIDVMLLDIEGGETPVLPMFLKGGAFDQNNITVCSLIMEYHNQRKAHFPSWVTQLIEDKRWVFLTSDNSWQHRQFLAVNVEQQPCFDRYVKRFFPE